MSNYYTLASFIIECNSDQVSVSSDALNILLNMEDDGEELIKSILVKNISDLTPQEAIVKHCFLNHSDQNSNQSNYELSWGFDFTPDEYGIWIAHSESINIDEAALFTQSVLRAFDISNQVLISYACTCDRPRIDAFSGGYCIVTKDEIAHDPSLLFLSSTQTAYENKSRYYIHKTKPTERTNHTLIELLVSSPENNLNNEMLNNQEFLEITPFEHCILSRFI